MIQLGNYNTLRILRHTDPGIYLEGDETTGDILLPKRYVTNEMHDGDEVQVFVYLDLLQRHLLQRSMSLRVWRWLGSTSTARS